MKCDELIEAALWAIKSEDLRHQFIYSKTIKELNNTSGISKAFETTIVVAIYQAAISKNSIYISQIAHEHPYPTSKKQNPKRADLAIKDTGAGTNWKYIEVKYASSTWKTHIAADIQKLRSITKKVQRWMMIYGICEKGPKQPLYEKIKAHFASDFTADEVYERTFQTNYNDKKDDGVGFILLAKIHP